MHMTLRLGHTFKFYKEASKTSKPVRTHKFPDDL